MPQNDLTTLANVKAWMNSQPNPPPSVVDQTISRVISRVSAVVLGYLSRDSLLYTQYSEVYDGKGGRSLMMRRWPVLSISQLIVSNQLIVPAPPMTTGTYASTGLPGYNFPAAADAPPGRMQLLSLTGAWFARGFANVSLTYKAGYVRLAEPGLIDADNQYRVTPIQPYGLIARDEGVTYANGTPMVAVASSPAIGQYVPPNPLTPTNPTSYYQFAAADDGANVLLNYSYIPDVIENAVCDMAGERMSYRARIGQSTQMLSGQESAAFELKDMPDYIKLALQPYRQVVPV